MNRNNKGIREGTERSGGNRFPSTPKPPIIVKPRPKLEKLIMVREETPIYYPNCKEGDNDYDD